MRGHISRLQGLYALAIMGRGSQPDGYAGPIGASESCKRTAREIIDLGLTVGTVEACDRSTLRRAFRRYVRRQNGTTARPAAETQSPNERLRAAAEKLFPSGPEKWG